MKIALNVDPIRPVQADMLPCLASLASNRNSLYMMTLNQDTNSFIATCLSNDSSAMLVGKSSSHTARELEDLYVFVPNAEATLSNGSRPDAE